MFGIWIVKDMSDSFYSNPSLIFGVQANQFTCVVSLVTLV